MENNLRLADGRSSVCFANKMHVLIFFSTIISPRECQLTTNRNLLYWEKWLACLCHFQMLNLEVMLRVFQFLLSFTKCPQLEAKNPSTKARSSHSILSLTFPFPGVHLSICRLSGHLSRCVYGKL